MEKRYDHVVLGSGIGGMTAAVLLAQNGRSVLLLEKARYLGGSVRRFPYKGLKFDGGFHFTGGFGEDGLLTQMLRVMGIEDCIEPLYLDEVGGNRFVMEETGAVYDFPAGRTRLTERLKEYFPSEGHAIDTFLAKIYSVCERTPTMDLRNIDTSMVPLEEDHITLQMVLDDLTSNRDLQGALSGFSLCYGASPTEVSFANHARMCEALYESVARVKHGGDAFLDACVGEMTRLGVDIRRGVTVAECADVKDRKVGRFVLTTGEEVEFESAVLAIHPKSILELLPPEVVKKAFRSRVNDFEASCGFYAQYGTVEHSDAQESHRMTSFFPTNDLNALLAQEDMPRSALVIVESDEEVKGDMVRGAIALESCDPSCMMDRWADSRLGRRPEAYYDLKERKGAEMRGRINSFLKQEGRRFDPLTTSTSLTFRDYLHSPDGSAYGIRQKMGQFNVFGKLPALNLYAAGQNALLPGIMGAMMSSFIVARSVLDRADFATFVQERLRR